MNMRQFLLKRVLVSILLIFIVTTLNFYLFRIMPGDPIAIMFNPAIGPEAKEIMMKEMGLDKPITEQYIIYMKNILQGNLGYSYLEHKAVAQAITERLPNTLLLMLTSNFFAITIGIVLGVVAAWKRGTVIDIASIISALTFYSLPMFWLGGLLIILFSVQLDMFPIFGIITPGLVHANAWEYWADVGRHLFLPTLAMTISGYGGLFLVMRNTMIDALTEDYTLTAQAIGLRNRTIIFKNVLRNALLPVITIITLRLGFMVGGAILTETVFSWPGIGQLSYRAVFAHDYQMLQGLFLIITVIVILANLVADILYGYADPRVRY